VRALLEAFAVGDAVGMATEFMTRREIVERFGMVGGLTDPALSKNHGDLRRGQVTDDTEQVLCLLDEYCLSGGIDPRRTAERLLRWARESGAVEKRYIGPSSKAALQAIAEGADPAEAGKRGTTCGGVMRSPSAALYALCRGLPLAESVRACLLPTHNTGPALGAAVAYARALECALAGGSPDEVAGAAASGEAEGATFAPWTLCAPSVGGRVAHFRSIMAGFSGPGAALDFLYGVFGTGLESADVAAAAFCLYFWAPDDPWLCVRMGASVGGDTDTIAALAGMLAAATRAAKGRGHGIPESVLAEVMAGNNLDLAAIADRVAGGAPVAAGAGQPGEAR
jgi:ADP-ribosylglycohydrolase